MKKSGKITAYLLVLVLVTGFLSGLGVKSTPASAEDKPEKQFKVLEIVPDMNMATFGYLVAGQEPVINGKTVAQNCTGSDTFKDYLVGKNYGTYSTSEPYYTSRNYFVKEILEKINGDVEWKVTVTTVTPTTLKSTDVSPYHMIVINSSVPSDLQLGLAQTHFSGANDFDAESAFKVFKKIAGVEGDPVPYIVDFDLYYGGDTSSFVDTLDKNGFNKFGFMYADELEKVGLGDYETGYVDNNSDKIPNHGTSRNSFKLYKLLSCIDPATLYGLYCTDTDGGYGVSCDYIYNVNSTTKKLEKTGSRLNLIGINNTVDGNPSPFSLNGRIDYWTDEYFRPNYLRISSHNQTTDNGHIDQIMSDMGWFEVSGLLDTHSRRTKEPSDFFQIIGGLTGKGIVYKNSSGLCSILNGTANLTSGTNNVSVLGKMIASFFNTQKNDYHPYKFLVVNDNDPDTTVNRNVIARMVKTANAAGKGLVGGIVVECMSKYQFDNIAVDLYDTYDAICVNGTPLTAGQSKLSAYSTKGGLTPAFTPDKLIEAFNTRFTSSFGVQFVTTPVEYYTDFNTNFRNENGINSYMSSGKFGRNEDVFINGNSHGRTLDIKLKVVGSGKYKVELFVDSDRDDKFEDNSEEKETLTSEISGNSLLDKTGSHAISLEKFLGKDYVGGFSWKILITDNESGATVSKVGFSACTKNTATTDDQKIKILQIYPTDYASNYADSEVDSIDEKYYGNQKTLYSNPLLILPTKDDISRAVTARGCEVSTYLTESDTESDPGKGPWGLQKYFEGCLEVDVVSSTIANGTADANGIYGDDLRADHRIGGIQRTLVGSGGSVLTMTGSASGITGKAKRVGITKNASFLYYYINKLDDYDVDVTRFSVYEYNYIIEKKHDLNGDACEIKFNPTTKKIYMQKGSTIVEYDLLILGFGSAMDWMSEDGIKVITDYIDKLGPVFCGYGTVNVSENNTLGKALMPYLGMSNATTTGYNPQNNGAAPLMVTNNTLFAHYPYTVNRYLKATCGYKQPYRLNLAANPDLVGSYARYNYDDFYAKQYDYGNWGDIAENYYLYKNKSITYCGFGDPFPDQEVKQQGGVMTMAETILVVNALVTSARYSSSPISDDPYLKCRDIDASIIAGKFDDAGNPTEIYYAKDGIYTDYDAFGLTKYKNADLVFNAAILTEAVQKEADGLVIDDNSDVEGFTDPTTNIRWIPYKAGTSVPDEAFIEFVTMDDTPKELSFQVKVYSNVQSKYLDLAAVDADHPNRYPINKNGIYYIGVPLNYDSSVYSGKSSSTYPLGFKFDKNTGAPNTDQFSFKMILRRITTTPTVSNTVIEEHKITMARRVLYPVK